ncbi:hypothetical protein FKW77_010169 [Venturia effusa]|uniref:Uncharacterized protein n=1 Tax=Venturia effusa TaxID=50376 RepID=A0A517L8D7_9PEZI|nr:hypothetical protein FKW77_010169 [Venturia effusa]
MHTDARSRPCAINFGVYYPRSTQIAVLEAAVARLQLRSCRVVDHGKSQEIRHATSLFENDADCDIESEIEADLSKLTKLNEPDFLDKEQEISIRNALNAGAAAQLFQQYSETDVDAFYGDYKVIILSALMMIVGANLDQPMRKYIEKALPTIKSRSGFTLALWDPHFRDSGKAQFTAMFENYENGKPRALETR